MSILAPGNLLIWLPGLLFVAALVYSSLRVKKGTASTATRLAPLGLFVLAAFVAVLIPQQEMDKALRFANAHASHAGAPVASYTDIDYAAKDAWFRTALPEAERGDELAAGGDPFSFEEPAASAEAAQEPASADASGGDAAGLVYQPERGIAWMVLALLMIVGSLYFLQDIKGFVPSRR